MNAYAELRRATSYVRWHHGDALAYAPSLHARPASRSRGGGGSAELEGARELAAAEPLASEGVELGGNSPSAEVGLPGTNPFTNE